MTGSNRGVSIGLAIASLGLVGGAIASSPDPVREKSERKVDFNREVLPILSEHCFRCHGPDAASVAAGLRLDGVDTATADRGGY